MTEDETRVWQRLKAYALDDPSTSLPFTLRLARENGWSPRFARRVCEEYKRFCLLAVTRPHGASPSDEVDQAWHLHLTYTRDYWERFCPEVLGAKLHHFPTRGGVDEQRKHWTMYERTLADYREVFGHEPPEDIWPPAHVRFGVESRSRRVRSSDYWIIAKPRFLSSARRMLVAPAAICVGTGLFAAFTSPLDLSGPEFLAVYVTLSLLTLVVALVVRRKLRGPSVEQPNGACGLSPYEVACLVGGPKNALRTALATLSHQNHLKIEHRDTSRACYFCPTAKPLAGGESLDGRIMEAVKPDGATLKTITQFVDQPLGRLVEMLEQRNLVNVSRSRMARYVPSLLMAGVLALGVAKIVVGVERGRPVGFLVLLCIAVFVAVIYLLRTSQRTIAGDRCLDRLRATHSQTGEIAPSRAITMTPSEIAMMVGLFGTAVLPSAVYADIQSVLPQSGRKQDNNSWGCSNSGCGGFGCSAGGSCGGGGCGGGGYGGCSS